MQIGSCSAPSQGDTQLPWDASDGQDKDAGEGAAAAVPSREGISGNSSSKKTICFPCLCYTPGFILGDKDEDEKRTLLFSVLYRSCVSTLSFGTAPLGASESGLPLGSGQAQWTVR